MESWGATELVRTRLADGGIGVGAEIKMEGIPKQKTAPRPLHRARDLQTDAFPLCIAYRTGMFVDRHALQHDDPNILADPLPFMTALRALY